MSGVSYRSHSFQIFCSNSILPIRRLISFQSCIFIHNSIHSVIHSNLPLMTNADYHEHDTRHRRDIHFNGNNTTRHGCHSILHCSKRYYNDGNLVPYDFKVLNRNAFKIKLKKFFRSTFLNAQS
jgi:hypothetical protein